MKILYPWIRPEPLTLLWRQPPGIPLRKAQPRFTPTGFELLLDLLLSPVGRMRFRRLMREFADDPRRPRAPRMVGVR